MGRVNVIIPTFNRAKRLIRAISSVLDQTFTDFEIIVVDDGSTDGTNLALNRFGERILYEAHTQNRGVSAARNTGIGRACAPLIAFLDSDDYWLPEKLAVQVEYFDRHPCTMVSQTDEIWIRNGRRVNPRKRHQKPSGDIFKPSLRLCLVSPSAVMLRRSILDEVGLFDEDLPACEDYDLWLRISCRYPVYLIRQELVVKEGGHIDQLSRSHWGLDRYRIRALVKLIQSGVLDESQVKSAMDELSFKCRIYAGGCLKRGKHQEGNFYLQLPRNLKDKHPLTFSNPHRASSSSA
jgi:glycosyltransferase involved in cell wall biosynthesis